jgi:hypothetical protein
LRACSWDGNLVEFLSVPCNPPGAGHLGLQVENIFVNPSVLPPGSQFREDVTVFGPLSITIVDPIQVVAVNAPEPSTLLLAAMALGTAAWLGRLRWR